MTKADELAILDFFCDDCTGRLFQAVAAIASADLSAFAHSFCPECETVMNGLMASVLGKGRQS